MSYRSDVVIKCGRCVAEDIESLCQEFNVKPDLAEGYGELTVFAFYSWKWYETSDSFVKSIYELMQKYNEKWPDARDTPIEESFAYFRIGEDYDDYEEDGNTWDYFISLERKLVW